MHQRTFRGLRGLLAACVVLATSSVPALAGYTVTAAGSLGGPTTQGYALNNEGSVAGSSSLAGGGPGMPVVAGGQGVYDPSPSYARGGVELGISDTGHVAGAVNSDLHGTPIATFDGAPILGLGMTSQATGVNNAGMVVGQMFDPSSGACSFVAEAQAGPGGLPAMLTAALHDSATGALVMGSATGVNDSGQVVGNLQDGHAFLFNPDGSDLGAGRLVDLGDLPALRGGTSRAVAINAFGQVIGTDSIGGTPGGFLYISGSVAALPFAPAGINALGQVVGTTIDPATAAVKLLLYDSRFGTTTDLSAIDLGGGFRLAGAAGINDGGQILVNGTRADSASPVGYDEQAFVLTPTQIAPSFLTPSIVPEPAGATLALVGGLGLLAARVIGRRRPRHS